MYDHLMTQEGSHHREGKKYKYKKNQKDFWFLLLSLWLNKHLPDSSISNMRTTNFAQNTKKKSLGWSNVSVWISHFYGYRLNKALCEVQKTESKMAVFLEKPAEFW